MHVKIGTMDESLASEFVYTLRSAGIKVEMKPYFDVEFEEVGCIEGRIDELVKKYGGTKYEEVVREWEDYLNKGREILNKPMDAEEFIVSFIHEFVEEGTELEEVFNQGIEKICEERNLDIDELSDEQKAEIVAEVFKRFKKDIIESFERELKRERYEFIASKLLEFSGTEDGIIEKISDSISIEVQVDDAEEAKELGMDVKLEISVRKMFDVYANLTDAFYERDRLVKIIEEFDDAFKLLVVADIGLSTHKYLEKEGRIEIDDIIDLLNDFDLGEDINVSMEDEAAMELLKLLEKEEFVKIKKGKIKAM